jgi:hypothetical protein
MWSGNTTEHECVMPEKEALEFWFPVLDSLPLNSYGNAWWDEREVNVVECPMAAPAISQTCVAIVGLATDLE